LETNSPPLVLDEVQYVPGLFPYLKMSIDQSGQMGRYYLTGSQQFDVMKGVTGSLAGRIAVLPMLGLSAREIRGCANSAPFFAN
jgi:predicted AAA+ superfamily ATPase